MAVLAGLNVMPIRIEWSCRPIMTAMASMVMIAALATLAIAVLAVMAQL